MLPTCSKSKDKPWPDFLEAHPASDDSSLLKPADLPDSDSLGYR